MELDQKTGPDVGYLRVQLIVRGKATDLWQAIQLGEVAGYFDSKGAPFVLPGVYEMRVMGSVMMPDMAVNAVDAGPLPAALPEARPTTA